MSTSTSIYNATDGPLAIDRAGRMLAAGEHRDVDSVDGSPLAGHIADGRIVIVDASPVDEESDAEGDPAPESTTTRTRKGRASTSTQEA